MEWKKIGKWLLARWKTVGIIAVIFYLALTNALGGYANVAARKALELARGWYSVRQAENAQWKVREAAWTAQIAEARGRLAAARKPVLRPIPISALETAARFKELGYEGRVR